MNVSKLSCAVLFSVLLTGAGSALAHRVNLFAYQENDRVLVESKFNGGKPARNAEVIVKDDSGAKIYAGKTAEDGTLAFRLPESLRTKDIVIELYAGEGHKATWTLELEQTARPQNATPSVERARAESSLTRGISRGTLSSESLSSELSASEASVPGALTFEVSLAQSAAVRKLIAEAVAEERRRVEVETVAPLKKQIAQLQNPEIGWREIFGGIGWIFGLFGLAAWFQSTRRKKA